MKKLLVISVCSALLFGCNSAGQSASTDAQVSIPVANVAALTASDSYVITKEFTGMVEAANQASLGFELGGKVDKVWVSTGDRVAVGEPLLRLDTAILQTEQAQIIAQKNQLDAQLNLIDANLKRQRTLKSKGFSAEAEIDSLTSERRVLIASQNQLDASLATVNLRIEKSTLYAPYSGLVANRFVSIGDVVNVGQSAISLLSSEQLEASIGLPTELIANVLGQDSFNLRINGSDYPAQLIRQAAQIDRLSRTQILKFSLPHDQGLLNGQLAYLAVKETKKVPGYWVPVSALTDGVRGVWNVFALDNDNRIERRTVNVIHANQHKAYITGAIHDGDQLVVNGLHRLVPGQIIEPRRESDQ
ncbi:efflux RND transporter periplasmic adaptor subunit [Thaumasiovibrio subtropicus]|uniref:efflux RND transporter periplasmic adaptor subunit n=1 Tax=Thaumasiovibrio subtropicus TaxID=1891207 RepID=UPI000B3580ED|nr:efflux RND transporter periplasmic adaptor subunit [Thaumasiovibrio subtropicus]